MWPVRTETCQASNDEDLLGSGGTRAGTQELMQELDQEVRLDVIILGCGQLQLLHHCSFGRALDRTSCELRREISHFCSETSNHHRHRIYEKRAKPKQAWGSLYILYIIYENKKVKKTVQHRSNTAFQHLGWFARFACIRLGPAGQAEGSWPFGW